MAKLEVLRFPDERLRNKADEITNFSSSALVQSSQDMLETMYAENGIGLAAIQVNIKQRLIVIDVSEKRNAPMILCNPVITETIGQESMQEGCLSVPEFVADVERAERIKYTYQNINGEHFNAEADGLLAVCIQHEIDHLEGRLFIDYLSALKRQRLKKKLQKLAALNADV